MNKTKNLTSQLVLFENSNLLEVNKDKFEEDKVSNATLELPQNWWFSQSTLGIEQKKKFDLIHINKRKSIQKLPLLAEWKINDGDYIHTFGPDEEQLISDREVKRRQDKIYFLAMIGLVVLIVVFFASLTSSVNLSGQ